MTKGNITLTEQEGWWQLCVCNPDGGQMISLSAEELEDLRALLQKI